MGFQERSYDDRLGCSDLANVDTGISPHELWMEAELRLRWNFMHKGTQRWHIDDCTDVDG
jgi:hypothetical protein